MHFGDRLSARARQVGTATCVGLDPHLNHLPAHLLAGAADLEAQAAAAGIFCRGVIEVVADRVAAVKPQVAFFEALGHHGVRELEICVRAAKAAGLIVVLDAKRGDIGSTAEAYARACLDDDGPMGADAVTLSPYLGAESMAPFLKRVEAGKGIFVLVRTSNPGSGVWQTGEGAMAPKVAAWIATENARRAAPGQFGPVGAVIAAKLPGEAAGWREAMPQSWFLVPGFGAQGATAGDVRGHFRDGLGALITSSRGVLFPTRGADGPDWQARVAERASQFAEDVRAAST